MAGDTAIKVINGRAHSIKSTINKFCLCLHILLQFTSVKCSSVSGSQTESLKGDNESDGK